MGDLLHQISFIAMSSVADSPFQKALSASHHQQLYDKEIAETLISGSSACGSGATGEGVVDISIEGPSRDSSEKVGARVPERPRSSELTLANLMGHNNRVFVGPQHFSIMKLIGEVE